jgi:hypothetical protein
MTDSWSWTQSSSAGVVAQLRGSGAALVISLSDHVLAVNLVRHLDAP